MISKAITALKIGNNAYVNTLPYGSYTDASDTDASKDVAAGDFNLETGATANG